MLQNLQRKWKQRIGRCGALGAKRRELEADPTLSLERNSIPPGNYPLLERLRNNAAISLNRAATERQVSRGQRLLPSLAHLISRKMTILDFDAGGLSRR
jgi:hypothetical protein